MMMVNGTKWYQGVVGRSLYCRRESIKTGSPETSPEKKPGAPKREQALASAHMHTRIHLYFVPAGCRSEVRDFLMPLCCNIPRDAVVVHCTPGPRTPAEALWKQRGAQWRTECATVT